MARIPGTRKKPGKAPESPGVTRGTRTAPYPRMKMDTTTNALELLMSQHEEVESLIEKTERYCTVLQTLTEPPKIETELATGG